MKSFNLSPARISRSLVTIMVLTLIQVIGTPIFNVNTPSANAVGDPALIQTDLMFAGIGSDFNGNGVTLVGTPSYTAGPPAYYTFDSDAKYAYKNIDYPNNHAASIFMWVYPTAAGIILNLNATSAQDSGHRTSMIDYTGSKFRFGLYDGVTGTVSVEANVATPPNNWYFIGFTYSGGAGGTLTSYVNGAATGSVVVTNGWDTPSDVPGGNYFHFGSQSSTGAVVGTGTPSAATVIRGGGRYRLNEAVFYNSSQSSADVLANYNATAPRFGPTVSAPSSTTQFVNRSATFTSSICSGTTSGSATCTYQWQVSTDGGTSYSDISGATSTSYTTPILTSSYNGYKYRLKAIDPGTGTSTATDIYNYSAVATLTVTTPPGSDTDTALLLNGNSQYVEVSDYASSPFDSTGTITIEAWIYPTSSCTSDQAIISKYLSYMMYCGGGVLKYVYSASGTSWSGTVSTIPIKQNEWHHIAYTKSAASTDLLIYVDGYLVATVNAGPTSMTANDQVFSIGRYNGGNYFQGQIDEVKIFNTQRTQSQIQGDMSTYGPISDANLSAYYDFNEGTGTTLFNRDQGATSASDLTVYGSPTWQDVKSVDTNSLNTYTTVQFSRTYLTQNQGWKVPTGISKLSYLVVAGGGAGGGGYTTTRDFIGGGGGGGGVRMGTLTSPSGYFFPVVGPGQQYISCQQDRGRNSSISGTAITTISATGGGSGGCWNGSGWVNAQTGGSGGGAGAQVGSSLPGSGNDGGYSPVEGYIGGTARTDAYVAANQASGGGGGAAGAGGAGSTATGGTGGLGIFTDYSGSTKGYGSGGGGGTRSTGSGGTVSDGGGAGGVSLAQGFPGTYGQGGGGGGTSSQKGNSGGTGVVYVRWINASVPVFTQPVIDTTTAGLTDSFTVSNNPTGPLTRSFSWQFSNDTGTTWSNLISGTGYLTNTYTTLILETTTSGARYKYRVLVSDTDTYGLSISDTSNAVYLIVNPRITYSGTYTTQKYGSTHQDTFTVSNGTGIKALTFTPNNRTGITWDTSTANIARLTIGSGLNAGTYYETITATDSKGAQTLLPLSIVVSKADTITVATGTSLTTVYTGIVAADAPKAVITGLVGADTATVSTNYYSATCAQGGLCKIGDVGPGGGNVFYISDTVIDSATGVSSGGIYLEAAPRNWNGDASGEAGSSFASVLTAVSGTSSAIGTGAENSRLLIAALGTNATAATLAVNKTSGGVSDWFVPSYDELTKMITVLAPLGLGSFNSYANLWSSTQNSSDSNRANNAWSSNPPVLNTLLKTDNYYLRPIRAFSPTVFETSTPVDVETYTAIGANLTFLSGTLSNYQGIIYETSTLKITQANQNKLTLNLYGAVAGAPFTLQVGGGSGSGEVTETVTAGSTALNCRISNHVLSNDTPATEQKSCNISITKASSRNYKAETLTATVYFMLFANNQPTGLVGSGSTIAINGATSLTIDTTTPPSITGFSTLTLTLSTSDTLTINGTGFTGSVTIKFWRNKVIVKSSPNTTTLQIPFSEIASLGASSGRVAVITANGEAVSVDSLTINP